MLAAGSSSPCCQQTNLGSDHCPTNRMAIEPSDWKLSSSVSIASSRAKEAAADLAWNGNGITEASRAAGPENDEAATPASETASSFKF